MLKKNNYNSKMISGENTIGHEPISKPHALYKINSRWFIDIKVNYRTIWFLEEIQRP